MGAKVLIKSIDGCHNCPYLKQDVIGTASGDLTSGYDCTHSDRAAGRRVATTWQVENDCFKIKIPSWCPLPDSGFAIEYHTKETDKHGKSH